MSQRLTANGATTSRWLLVRDALRRRRPAALDRVRAELADANAQLVRRQSFTDALLETIEVGIVSCDADGVFVVSNRAERAMFGLSEEGLTGLVPEQLEPMIDVFDTTGRALSADEYPLMRTLRGEDVSRVDVLVGPSAGPRREVVVRGSRIVGPDGELLGAVAALTDVTVERTALRALDEERHRLAEAQLLGQFGGFDHNLTTGEWTFSDQLCALWGVPAGDFTPDTFDTLIVEQDRESAARSWRDAAFRGGHHGYEFRFRRADDAALRVVRARIKVEIDDDEMPSHIRGTHVDITDLAAARYATERATAFSDAILAASPDDTLVTDLATGAIIYASPGRHLLGLSSDVLVETGSGALDALVHPHDLPRLQELRVAAADLGDGELSQLRYRAMHADGQWRWLDHTVTPFRRSDSGTVLELLAVVRDVTELVRTEDLLTRAALHDYLTGLPNRVLLVQHLSAALERSRTDGREIAVLFCDLDGFKRVNDTGGHSAGDIVLAETARRLQRVVREHDMVARVGGDEFVVVVAPWECAEADDAQPVNPPHATRELVVDIAARITAALREPVTVGGLDHLVTTSIGITYATLAPRGRSGAVTVDQVLHNADAAMYLAKGQGKNRYEVLEL